MPLFHETLVTGYTFEAMMMTLAPWNLKEKEIEWLDDVHAWSSTAPKKPTVDDVERIFAYGMKEHGGPCGIGLAWMRDGRWLLWMELRRFYSDRDALDARETEDVVCEAMVGADPDELLGRLLSVHDYAPLLALLKWPALPDEMPLVEVLHDAFLEGRDIDGLVALANEHGGMPAARHWIGWLVRGWSEDSALVERTAVQKKAPSNDNDERANYVTVTRGIRGWFAVLLWWNPEHGGFWEPLNSGVESFDEMGDAVKAGVAWAEAEGIAFKLPKKETT